MDELLLLFFLVFIKELETVTPRVIDLVQVEVKELQKLTRLSFANPLLYFKRNFP